MNGWKFLRLVYALRETGITLSTQDIYEALKCLNDFPNISEQQILQATLIHNTQDLLIFKMIWKELFQKIHNPKNTLIQDQIDSKLNIGSGGQGFGHGGGGSTQSPLNIPNLSLSSLITQSFSEDLPSDLEYEDLIKRILAELNYFAWINAIELAYHKSEITEEAWINYQEQNSALQEIVKQIALSKQINAENSWQPLVRQNWRIKPLQSLSEEEKGLVQAAIVRWGRKLAVRPGWRYKQSSKGDLDIHRTVKGAFHTDGNIFHLRYHKGVPRIPELIVLCDVSNSVAPYVEFLLFLVGRIRARFRKVRLYFFIDTLWDVPDQIWDEDLGEIKEEIATWGRKATSGFSDYGQVFQEFADNELPEFSSRATLLIMGDGKNNYRPTRSEYLSQIKEHVRKVFWLNPLNVEEWSDRENTMSTYSPYCTQIFRCRTGEDLFRIAKKLV